MPNGGGNGPANGANTAAEEAKKARARQSFFAAQRKRTEAAAQASPTVMAAREDLLSLQTKLTQAKGDLAAEERFRQSSVPTILEDIESRKLLLSNPITELIPADNRTVLIIGVGLIYWFFLR